MLRFDAYSATTTAAKPTEMISMVAEAVPFVKGWTIHQGKGFHTFKERVAFKGSDGAEFASVMWGGNAQGDRVMLEVKGEHTPAAVELLRARFPHRCTRVDSCADFDAPRAFERLYRQCRTVKKAHGIEGGKAGDWEDFPEKGRTLYLGAKTSATRLRLYEKGKQPEYAHLRRPDWARIEVQVRPAKDAKSHYSELSASDVWGASRWTRELSALALQSHVDPHPAGTTYRLTEREAALAWMCKQYGSHLVSLAADLGGWAELGLTLSEMIREGSNGKEQ